MKSKPKRTSDSACSDETICLVIEALTDRLTDNQRTYHYDPSEMLRRKIERDKAAIEELSALLA